MNRKKIIFFAYDLNIGGIESALVNLLDIIDYNKYDVTLILEKKEGINLNKINKNVQVEEYKLSKLKVKFFRKIVNFVKRYKWKLKNKDKYYFSCAYATYSKMGCKLAKLASKNNSLYVHSDYSYIYDTVQFKNFFNERDISKFKNIVFVSENSKNNFLKNYPDLENKTVVINNFIDSNNIIKLSNEVVLEKKDSKVLFVFVGRLDDSSKKLGRMLFVMKKLKENKVDSKLIVVGSGPDEKLC